MEVLTGSGGQKNPNTQQAPVGGSEAPTRRAGFLAWPRGDHAVTTGPRLSRAWCLGLPALPTAESNFLTMCSVSEV